MRQSCLASKLHPCSLSGWSRAVGRARTRVSTPRIFPLSRCCIPRAARQAGTRVRRIVRTAVRDQATSGECTIAEPIWNVMAP